MYHWYTTWEANVSSERRQPVESHPLWPRVGVSPPLQEDLCTIGTQLGKLMCQVSPGSRVPVESHPLWPSLGVSPPLQEDLCAIGTQLGKPMCQVSAVCRLNPIPCGSEWG